jgi:uncharacterized protein (DUF1330 family)
MAAYLIVHRREITDPEGLRKYSEGIDRTLQEFDGRVLTRKDNFEVLEGSWHPGEKGVDERPERVTVIRFPDMAALKGWYGSGDYAPLKAIRQRSSKSDIVAVEGG